MTDKELKDAAWAELAQTTKGWQQVKDYAPAVLAATHWGKGRALLDRIGATTPPPPPPPSSGWRGGRVYVAFGPSPTPPSHASEYDLLIMSDNWAAEGQIVGPKGLAYFSSVSGGFGVTVAEAQQNGWLAMPGLGSNGRYICDPGNQGYRDRVFASAVATCRQFGLDGINFDDCICDPQTLGVPMAKGTWEDRIVGFFIDVGGRLKAAGLYVAVNATGYSPGEPTYGDGSNTIRFWQRLAPGVSGLCNEYWAQRVYGPPFPRKTGAEWAGWQRLVSTAESAGCDFIGLTVGSLADTSLMSYAKHSYLLETSGRGGVSYTELTGGGNSQYVGADPWNDAWTHDYGMPAGPKRQNGSRWERPYTGGLIWVDPVAGTAGVA